MSVAPLSPFMWMSVENLVAAVDDCSLSFTQLASEVDAIHSAGKWMRLHPFHTHFLSRQQFDVLRYGLYLTSPGNLLICGIPREVGDSGRRIEQQYTRLFESSSTADEMNPSNPINEDHTLGVFFLTPSAAEGQQPKLELRFLLAFRNEAYNMSLTRHPDDHKGVPIEASNLSSDRLGITASQKRNAISKHFPQFHLRAVYCSHSKYYKGYQELRNLAVTRTDITSATILQHRQSEICKASELFLLCDQWLQTLNGLIPIDRDSLRVIHRNEVNVSLSQISSPRNRDQQAPDPLPPTIAQQYLNRLPSDTLEMKLETRLMCSYLTNEDRMKKRLSIVPRTTALINDWREGHLNCPFYYNDAGERLFPECCRVLFRDTRSGHNCVEGNELLAFIPPDCDCERFSLYATVAAERLRLWILKALLTAEIHMVHVLLMELDIPMFVSQCIGLLDGSHTSQDHNACFHVCKIIIETVEDFLQHSGAVWSVTLAILDADRPLITDAPNNSTSTETLMLLCQNILECIWLAKKRIELDETAPPMNPTKTLQPAVAATHRSADGGNALRPSENLLFSASCFYRVALSDDQLYPLFQYCDPANVGSVSVKELTKLFLCEDNNIDDLRDRVNHLPYRVKRSESETHRMREHNLTVHPLCPLDGCGLTFNEKSISQFLLQFCRNPSRVGSEPRLNYQEFAMMMLSLAKR